MNKPAELFEGPGEQKQALAVQSPTSITPLSLIQSALNKNVAPEVLKELVALQQSMIRFDWEAQERQAKIDFDSALNQCQAEIGRIAPNQTRENNIGWADYAQVDRNVRPVYIKAGFSIGFSEVDSPDPNRIKMKATLSRGGVAREYFDSITRTPSNPKMNLVDAEASASSRVKRYLLLKIFNIAIGIDALEKEGIPEDQVEPYLKAIRTAPDSTALHKVYLAAKKAALAVKDDNALRLFTEAGANRQKELINA